RMRLPVLIKEKKRPETHVIIQSISSVERYTFIKIRNKICKPGMFMKSVVGISDHFHAGIFLFYFFDEGQRNRFAFDQQEIIILSIFRFFENRTIVFLNLKSQNATKHPDDSL